MVERTEAQQFEEFEGLVTSVEKVPSEIREGDQYKISIQTELTTSGNMYTWIGVPKTATEKTVPQGSVIDAYIRALERIDSEIKKLETVDKVFKWMSGKKFLFSREKLGKAYDGHEAADYWVPIKVVE